MDLYSRKIVGWSVSKENNSELTKTALRGAILARGGRVSSGIIHHSDRGSTYASGSYRKVLTAFGIRQSMSSKGNCYDNAAMESFFGRYKTSSIGNHIFEDIAEVRSHVFNYIELFYNRFRKHSALGYKCPEEIESKKFPPMGGNPTSGLSACVQSN